MLVPDTRSCRAHASAGWSCVDGMQTTKMLLIHFHLFAHWSHLCSIERFFVVDQFFPSYIHSFSGTFILGRVNHFIVSFISLPCFSSIGSTRVLYSFIFIFLVMLLLFHIFLSFVCISAFDILFLLLLTSSLFILLFISILSLFLAFILITFIFPAFILSPPLSTSSTSFFCFGLQVMFC